MNRGIQSQLRIGRQIEYFDARANRQCAGQILEFRKKEVLVRQREIGEYWLIPFRPSISMALTCSSATIPPAG